MFNDLLAAGESPGARVGFAPRTSRPSAAHFLPGRILGAGPPPILAARSSNRGISEVICQPASQPAGGLTVRLPACLTARLSASRWPHLPRRSGQFVSRRRSIASRSPAERKTNGRDTSTEHTDIYYRGGRLASYWRSMKGQ